MQNDQHAHTQIDTLMKVWSINYRETYFMRACFISWIKSLPKTLIITCTYMERTCFYHVTRTWSPIDHLESFDVGSSDHCVCGHWKFSMQKFDDHKHHLWAIHDNMIHKDSDHIKIGASICCCELCKVRSNLTVILIQNSILLLKTSILILLQKAQENTYY
jgi:hypothetical protein